VTEKSSLEKKHSSFFRDPAPNWTACFLFTLVVITLGIVLFVLLGLLDNDPTPDSLIGYTYAIVGTLFMLIAAIAYTRFRQSRKRAIGQLNGSLHWHIGFGIIALVLLLLHSFGNFNPRTGTYALYGMIALIISGTIGRTLDRIVPKLIAREVSHALTERGEDRAEHHTSTIQSIVSYKMTAWDLSYFPVRDIPEGLQSNEEQNDLAPVHQDGPAQSPDVEDHLTELHGLQRALRREEFYRAIIRYWRVAHVVLVFITVGLMLWHLEYATTLLLPAYHP
jgi:hypothetical protein